MLKRKTVGAIRKDTAPLFLAVASLKDAKVSVFRDDKNDTLFMAQANAKGVAFSPITGKPTTMLSVGEVAASGDETLNGSKAITAKCRGKKCGCITYTTAAMAETLAKSGEKTINCTACGAEIALSLSTAADKSEKDEEEDDDDAVVEDDVDAEDVGDESEDDDAVVMDDEDDMGDDEEVVDDEDIDADDVGDDEGDEDEEDESDEDEEVARLMKEVASATGEDESNEDDKKLDEEVAALLKDIELATEGDADAKKSGESDTQQPSPGPDANADKPAEGDGTTLAYAMHQLADLSKGKTRVLFVDPDTAFLVHADEGAEERQLGTFSRNNAQEDQAKLYDNRKVFGGAVASLIGKGALAGEAPADELAAMGFKSIMLSLPLTAAQTKLTNEAVAAAKAAAVEQASTALTDVSENFSKLVAIAAVGLDKGVLGDGSKSFCKELTAQLHSFGVQKAGQVAQRICEAKFKPFMAAVIAEAKELAAKDPSYVAGLAATIGKASYAAEELPAPSTVHKDDSNDQERDVSVASIEDFRDRRPTEPNKLQSVLSRLGRGRSFG